MINKRLANIQAAFDEESFEWMEANAPELLRGVLEDVNSVNATPDEVYKHISNRYGREAIALRCQQAARHYLATREVS